MSDANTTNESGGFFDKLKDAADKAGDMIGNVADKIGDEAGELLEKVGLKDEAEALLDTVQKVSHTVAEKVGDTVETVAEKVGLKDDDAPSAPPAEVVSDDTGAPTA